MSQLDGINARLDEIERRLQIVENVSSVPVPPTPVTTVSAPTQAEVEQQQVRHDDQARATKPGPRPTADKGR